MAPALEGDQETAPVSETVPGLAEDRAAVPVLAMVQVMAAD
jgi:hypothetical protein